MLSGFLRLIPILVLAGIAGLIGESFLGDELGWLIALLERRETVRSLSAVGVG